MNSLVQQQVDGLIVASSQLNDAEYQKINAGLPVVQMDRLIAGSELPLVITDSVNATADTVERSRANIRMRSIFSAGSRAFRRPAIGWPASSGTGARRRNVQTGMDHQRAATTPARVTRCSLSCAHSWGVRQSAVHRGLWPAGRVLRYLTQHQLMESDIHLCSFDDHYLFDCMTLKIDTVAQDCRALAQHSFDGLPRASMSGRWAENALYLPGRIHWRHAGSRALLAGE